MSGEQDIQAEVPSNRQQAAQIAREVIAELEVIRMRRGLTQAEVCRRMGVCKSSISSWQFRVEQGKTLSLRIIHRWAAALDCTLTVSLSVSGEFAKR